MYDLLKLKNKGLKTPLAHARGFGAAHTGLHHWVVQRVTALINLILVAWFVSSAITHLGRGFMSFFNFVQAPINAMLLCALIVSSCVHMITGLQVVIEDYLHKNSTKYTCLILLHLVGWGAMIVGLFAILKIMLGSSYVSL